MGGLYKVGDNVLRAGRVFDIREKERPSLGLKSVPEFLGDAGLSHAPLSGEQDVVAAANPRFEHLQLGFAVEKIIASHPTAG